MKKKGKFGFGMYLLFLLYVGLMIWLLFGQRTKGSTADENLNLVPLKTLKLYADLLQNSSNGYLVRHAFINLVGNVIMFIPLGYLLPGIWKKLQNFIPMLLYSVILISSIEILQYLSGLGSCDIDDLILNVPGIVIGWFVLKIKIKKS